MNFGFWAVFFIAWWSMGSAMNQEFDENYSMGDNMGDLFKILPEELKTKHLSFIFQLDHDFCTQNPFENHCDCGKCYEIVEKSRDVLLGNLLKLHQENIDRIGRASDDVPFKNRFPKGENRNGVRLHSEKWDDYGKDKIVDVIRPKDTPVKSSRQFMWEKSIKEQMLDELVSQQRITRMHRELLSKIRGALQAELAKNSLIEEFAELTAPKRVALQHRIRESVRECKRLEDRNKQYEEAEKEREQKVSDYKKELLQLEALLIKMEYERVCEKRDRCRKEKETCEKELKKLQDEEQKAHLNDVQPQFSDLGSRLEKLYERCSAKMTAYKEAKKTAKKVKAEAKRLSKKMQKLESDNSSKT